MKRILISNFRLGRAQPAKPVDDVERVEHILDAAAKLAEIIAEDEMVGAGCATVVFVGLAGT